jgi:hypothetical protein
MSNNPSNSEVAKSEKRTPLDIINGILDNPKDIENVRSLTSDDVTYVSLNYSNPNLKKIMPWCGTSKGPESIVKTFVDVGRFWIVKAFEKEAQFTDGENVAIFGRFTYTSSVLSKTVTSPFAVFAKVQGDRCTYLQFMEDTFATGDSFRKGGHWLFHSDPDGGEITI